MISLILPVTTNIINRNRHIYQVNVWLLGWCNQKKYKHLTKKSTPDILTPEESHLSQRGRILAQELAGIVDSALN